MKILVENETGLVKSAEFDYIILGNSVAVLETNNLKDVILNLNLSNATIYEVEKPQDFIFEVDKFIYDEGFIVEA